jgi:predicted component of type VI protein secretion system
MEHVEREALRHRIQIEYSPEGGGDPKAIELYSIGVIRELTYEAMG